MSDFYKCEHGSTLCGTCLRGLKTQHAALESENSALKNEVERLRKALTEILDADKINFSAQGVSMAVSVARRALKP